jgi:uncharacterized membrane protein
MVSVRLGIALGWTLLATLLPVSGYTQGPLYTFSGIVLPNAALDYAWTSPTGINNLGQITIGWNYYEHRQLQDAAVYLAPAIRHRFHCNGANQWTVAQGINDSGATAGWCYREEANGTPLVTAFVRTSGGALTILTPPGAVFAEATDVNNAGNVIGHMMDAAGQGFGWFYKASTKQFTVLAVPYPDSVFTTPLGLNNTDEIVGIYFSPPGRARGFLYKLRSNTWVGIDIPGTDTTVLGAINDKGVILGSANSLTHGGQVFTYKDGEVIPFTVPFPDLLAMNITDINNNGWIIGTYETFTPGETPEDPPATFVYGFLAVPIPGTVAPPPATMAARTAQTSDMAAFQTRGASGRTAGATTPFVLAGCPGDGVPRPGKLASSWALCSPRGKQAEQ